MRISDQWIRIQEAQKHMETYEINFFLEINFLFLEINFLFHKKQNIWILRFRIGIRIHNTALNNTA
jgi:hypothetical protein